MEIRSETLIGDIVRANYTTAQVFENYRIDYCCGGNISINEACSLEGVDVTLLITQLEESMGREDRGSKYIENLPLPALCDYIVETHHSYINDRAPFIQQKLQKLCEVHGDNHPELIQIREMFENASANLLIHMKNEESVLFPYIQKMVKMELDGTITANEIGNINSSIDELREEHQVEGDRFKKMSEITNYFQVPADGCNTFEVTYRTLDEFIKDLHRHIHLENNVLFPKSVILEHELTQNL